MKIEVAPSLTQLFGSQARVLSLAVLANANRPLTGYRIAKTAGVPKIKAYEQLRKALAAGWIARSGNGYSMPDGELRSLLRKRLRIRWSEDRPARLPQRATTPRPGEFDWFDPAKFPADPKVRARYAREFLRPPGKGEFPGMDPARRSRKVR